MTRVHSHTHAPDKKFAPPPPPPKVTDRSLDCIAAATCRRDTHACVVTRLPSNFDMIEPSNFDMIEPAAAGVTVCRQQYCGLQQERT